MALSLSSSILPFSKFSLNPQSSRKSRKRNAFHMAVRSSLPDDSTLLLQAARYTVDSFVESGMVIGLGSGRASGFAIQYLGRQLRSGAITDIIGIPTSVDSASEAAKAGVPLDQYRDSSKIDLAFDDADVIEEESLAAVIGRQKMQGGESIIQEKTILRAAGKLILIATAKQYQGVIDGSIPVLIKSINWLETAEEIDDLFLGDAEVAFGNLGHAVELCNTSLDKTFAW
ncbi:probable ribose-5-phosphate isomerase 4, chloroplastic isoform X1 [Sesamum indicum]|uniref:ribose-5-phosphate isomerase n=1 Tax=Sesamum indicum TaxID=4182 RepID=A0A8M8VCE7_SESIN|nr:probable ribose-5-phosphate isomerase 4, chloroplastic isoform X1 [Sesamum indicum]